MADSSRSHLLVGILLFLAGWAVFQWYPAHSPVQDKGRVRPVPAPRAPAEHRFASDGTFYMVCYAAAWTPRGTYGFEPGHEVHLLSECAATHTVIVSDGRQTIEVSPQLLTRDLDVAEAVRRADEAAQAALVNERERQREAYEIAHRPIYIAHARDAYAAELERVRGSAIGVSYNPLREPALPVDNDDVPNAVPSAPSRPASTSASTPPTDLDPALESFLNQSAFGRLPNASNGGR